MFINNGCQYAMNFFPQDPENTWTSFPNLLFGSIGASCACLEILVIILREKYGRRRNDRGATGEGGDA